MSANNNWQQVIRQVSQTTSSSSGDSRAEHSRVQRTFSEVGRTILQEVITQRVSKQYAYTRSGTLSLDQRESSTFPTWSHQGSTTESLTFNPTGAETGKTSKSVVKVTDFDNPDEKTSVRVVKTIDSPIRTEKKVLVTQRNVITDLDAEPELYQIQEYVRTNRDTAVSQTRLAVEPAPKLHLSDLTNLPGGSRLEMTKTEVQELVLPVKQETDNIQESDFKPITDSTLKFHSTFGSEDKILSRKESSERFSSDNESNDSLSEVLDYQDKDDEPLVSYVSQTEYLSSTNFSADTFIDPNSLLQPVASEEASASEIIDVNQGELDTQTVVAETSEDQITDELTHTFQKLESGTDPQESHVGRLDTKTETETISTDFQKPVTETEAEHTDGENPDLASETVITDVEKAETETETVATDFENLDLGSETVTAGVEKPDFIFENVATNFEKPDLESEMVVTDIEKPDLKSTTVNTDVEKPETKTDTVVTDVDKRDLETETVFTDVEKPDLGCKTVANDVEKTDFESENVSSDVEKPETETETVVSDVEKRDLGSENIATDVEKPKSVIEMVATLIETREIEFEAETAVVIRKVDAEAKTVNSDVKKLDLETEKISDDLEKADMEAETARTDFEEFKSNSELPVATNPQEQPENLKELDKLAEIMSKSLIESFVVIKPDEENEPEVLPNFEQIDDDTFSSLSAVEEPSPPSIPISEPRELFEKPEPANDATVRANKAPESSSQLEDKKHIVDGDREIDRSSIGYSDGKRKFKPVSSSFNRSTSTLSRHESLLRRNKSGSTSDLVHSAQFSQSFSESSMDPELFLKMMRQRRKSGSEDTVENNIEQQLEKRRIERISSIRRMDVQKRYNPGKSEPDVRSYSAYKPHKIGKLDLNSHLSSMMDKHKKRFEMKMKELYGEKYREIDIDYDDIINYWRNKQKNEQDDLIFGTGRRIRRPLKGANQNEDDGSSSGKQASASVQKTLDLKIMLQEFFADEAEDDSEELQKLLDDFIRKEDEEFGRPRRKSVETYLSVPHVETTQSLSESDIPQLLATPRSPGNLEAGRRREGGISLFSDTQEWFESEESPKNEAKCHVTSLPLDTDGAKFSKTTSDLVENVTISHHFYTPTDASSSGANPKLTVVSTGTAEAEAEATESSAQHNSVATKDDEEEFLSGEVQDIQITNRAETRVESSSKIWSSVATRSTGAEEFSISDTSISQKVPPLAVKKNGDEHDAVEHEQPMELQERSKDTSENGSPGFAADSTVKLVEDPLDDMNVHPKPTWPNTPGSSALSVRDENDPPAVLEPNQMYKVESQVTLASGTPTSSETKRLIEKDPDAEPGCCRNCVIL